MGMATSDDEWQIASDREQLDWAKGFPSRTPCGYDEGSPTEEEMAAHEHAVREYIKKKPKEFKAPRRLR